jgi:UDP:flavonoid glycosyltransferase YjiC (YdhE family)
MTWGSDGDVRPLLALAAGLVRRGHEVRVVATSVDDTEYAPLCARVGVPLTLVPERVNAPLAELSRAAGGNDAKLLRRLLSVALTPFLDELSAAAEALAAWSDVVVGHFMAWPLRAVSTRRGLPHVSFVPWPGMVPTTTCPLPGLPDVPGLTSTSWAAARLVVGHLVRPIVAPLWRRNGQPAFRDVFEDVFLSKKLTLVAASPALCPPPADWKTRVVCGALAFEDSEEPWQPDALTAAFLDEHPRPLFLSLGSSEQVAPERVRVLLVEAARHSKRATIVQLKSERASTSTRDGQVLFLPRAPHAQLFPRCAGVIHHGGAGTVHTVARAGVPSLTLGFVAEQMDWGRRLAATGAALAPRSFWKTKPEVLARSMSDLVTVPSFATSARALASTVGSEKGVERAVTLLEQCLR